MNSFYRIVAGVIYTVLFFLLFPWYCYVADVDGISYLYVAKVFANGEFFRSVNGCWSPLASWLLAPFYKMGFDLILSAKYLNGLIGLLTLFSSCSLIDKFNIHPTIKKILPFPIAIFLLSACFYELCADLLSLFILILYLNLVFSKNFFRNNYKIVLAGVVAALGYYAKAYCLPFILIHFFVATIFLSPVTSIKDRIFFSIRKMLIIAVVLFLLITPYVIALTAKYGSPRISNAGRLNITWVLSPGFGDTRKIVAAPFSDGTSYWDDPTFAQEKYVGPFTSFHYFIGELKWARHNTIQYVLLLLKMSIFSIPLMITFFIFFFYKKKNMFSPEKLLLLTTLIFPCGYILIYMDWRYVWLINILLMLMAGIVSKKLNWISLLVFASFLYLPISELYKMKDNGKDVYEMADSFKRNNIHGNFFANVEIMDYSAKAPVLAYLTQSKLFGLYATDYTFKEMMHEAAKYNINYFIYYYDNEKDEGDFLQSDYAKAGIKVFDNLYPGVVVVQLK